MRGWGCAHIGKPFKCGEICYTSEYDVYRRQILTYKVDHRTEKVK